MLSAEANPRELTRFLEGKVLYMAISKADAMCFNYMSCDCHEVMIVMEDRIIHAKHRENGEYGAIKFSNLSSFDESKYALKIAAPSDGSFRFDEVRYKDGNLDGVRYRFGDRYVFLFPSDWNLIVTKSMISLFGDDDDPIPYEDTSILFE